MQKTILITGATDGIGLATAKELAAQGHNLLLHGRSPSKLKEAAEQIQSVATGGKIETYLADFSVLADVNKLAEQVSAQHSHLDVLINNAGIYRTPHQITDDGLDVRFVVNTLAPYLLTQRLLPLLDGNSRVVNLSSAAQHAVDIELLTGRVKAADEMSAYAQSKLAITMWSHVMGLDHQNNPQAPLVVAVNPGSLLASKMVKEGFGVPGADISIGSDILCRAALSDEFAQASGQYFDNDAGKFASPHPDALNSEKTAKVIATIEALLAKLS